MRLVAGLLALSVLFGGIVFTHRYLYRRLFAAPGWPRRTQVAGAILIASLAVMMVVGASSGRWAPRPIAQLLAMVGFTWMGACFYLLLFTGTAHLFDRLGRWRASRRAPTNPGRRVVLQRAAVGAGGAAFGLTALGIRGALTDVEVRELEVRVPRLPPALSGLTLVQMTDIHVGPTLGQPFTRALAEKVRGLRPDAVVLTGDLVDGSVPTLIEHVAPLGGMPSRYGTFFVNGNHEFYSGAEAWGAALQKLGIDVLRNQRRTLGDGGGELELVGLEDWSRWKPEMLDPLLREADPDRARVVLAHQPHSIDISRALDADLQISGHTHGGQFFPFSTLVRLTTPYVAGFYRASERTRIYVSRGTGYWGPPMRLLAPAEITRIVLTT